MYISAAEEQAARQRPLRPGLAGYDTAVAATAVSSCTLLSHRAHCDISATIVIDGHQTVSAD